MLILHLNCTHKSAHSTRNWDPMFNFKRIGLYLTASTFLASSIAIATSEVTIFATFDDGTQGRESQIATQQTFHVLNIPYVWDSANDTGPIGTVNGSGDATEIQLTGQGGIPNANVAAVEMNVEVTPIVAGALNTYLENIM